MFARTSFTAHQPITRALRLKKPKLPTPPSWYKKHALMFGQYSVGYTNLPPVKEINPQNMEIFSVLLQKKIKIKLSMAALREIDRRGGLDEYILWTSDEDLGGEKSVGVALKKLLQEELKKKAGLENCKKFQVPQEKIFDYRQALNADFWKRNPLRNFSKPE